jgi:hypothetical protein
VRGERKGLRPQLRGVECKIPFLFFMFRKIDRLVATEVPKKSRRYVFFYIEKHKNI